MNFEVDIEYIDAIKIVKRRHIIIIFETHSVQK